ncbi:MAG TPA: vanadium-dependent haloperoxidase [Actinomycetes bacterium]
MKYRLATTLLVVVALFVAALSTLTTTTARPAAAAPGPSDPWPIEGYGYSAQTELTDNAILRWDERLLESIRAYPKVTGPTVSARAIGIVHTATYDAWAAYDDRAVDTRQRLHADPTLRQAGQGSEDNKTKAISYAAYRVLLNLFPGRAQKFRDYMSEKGYDPDDNSTDPTTPQGIGNNAAAAVLVYRSTDGSNQTPGTDPATGTPAAVYPSCEPACYQPVNSWQTLSNPWHWQPLCVPLVPYGTPCTSPSTQQKALTPQWRNVKSFALNPTTHYPPQFVLPGPPKLKNGTCCDPKDIDTSLKDTSNLSVLQRAKAEYWADGPGTAFPPGHMASFAQALSRMRHNTLDQDVKLFFGIGNALMDAGISAWQAKYQYDFVRPITAIRERYKGKQVTSWLGPGLGYGTVLGQDWRPYQEKNVVTPAFPEYVSGHSTFSAAGSLVLSMAFGNSAAFGAQATFKAGTSKIDPGTPATDVVLSWDTLIDTSDDAGWSRRWGGIHFETGDLHGRGLGKMVGINAWNKAQTYFDGTATATT